MSIFYTEQILQTKFYPKKSAQIATNLTHRMYKIKIIGYLWGKRLKIVSNKSGLKKKPQRIYPKTSSSYKTVWSPTFFTPTFQYVYTDIFVKSVTFRNSDG